MRDHQEQREAPEAAEALSSDPPSQSGEIRDNKNISATLSKSQHFHTRKHSKNLWKLEEKVEQLIIHVYFKHLTEVKIGTKNILPKKKITDFQDKFQECCWSRTQKNRIQDLNDLNYGYMDEFGSSESVVKLPETEARPMLYLATRW